MAAAAMALVVVGSQACAAWVSHAQQGGGLEDEGVGLQQYLTAHGLFHTADSALTG